MDCFSKKSPLVLGAPSLPAVPTHHVQSQFAEALSQYQSGQYQQALATWKHLSETLSDGQSPLLKATLLNYQSLAHQKLFQWQQSEAAIASSLDRLRPKQIHKTPQAQLQLYGQALNTQGRLYLELGQTQKAEDSWEEAFEIYQSLNDHVGIRGTRFNQTLALEQGGFNLRACLKLLDAIEIDSRCEFTQPAQIDVVHSHLTSNYSPEFQVKALKTLGRLLHTMGELQSAGIFLERAHQHAIVANLMDVIPSIQLNIAQLSHSKYQKLAQQDTRTKSTRLLQQLQPQVIALAQDSLQSYETVLNSIRSEPTMGHRLTQYQTEVEMLGLLIDHQEWLIKRNLTNPQIRAQLHQSLETLNHSPFLTHQINRSALFAQLHYAQNLIRLKSSRINVFQNHTTNLEAQLLTLQQIAQTQNDEQAQIYVNGILGQWYETQGLLPEAENKTQLALNKSSPLRNSATVFRWQWQMGRILQAQGDSLRAIQSYEQALTSLKEVRQDLVSLNRDAQLSFRDDIEPSYRQLVSLLLDAKAPSVENLNKARTVIDRLQVSEVEDFLLQNCVNASLASLDTFIEKKASTSALIYTILQEETLDIMVKFPGSDQIRFHRVQQSKAQINTVIENYRRSLQQKLPSAKQQSQVQGQQLYQWLIQPFEAEFQDQNINTLVFVLDGSLRDIPMGTLHDGQQYLIEQYAVAVTPGLQVLETRQPTSTNPRALIAGASQGNRLLGLSALPAVKQEIKQIASALPQTDILLDSAFTKDALQDSIQGQSAPIIHIATHGQFSSNPDETFIVTGAGERLDLSDLGQLLRQRTRTQSQTLELLFLSACQTLAGDRWAALGMAGVAIRSGAQSTIASIWNADDEASAELVSRFYAHLTAEAGRSKSEALRLAQVEMLNNPRYDLPVYWSPYVLIGNWQ